MKDPAFLFYYQDFLVGTDEMTNEEVGAYIRCLCHQAHKGSISEKHMKKICNSNDVQNAIKNKFKTDGGDETFFNERLRLEVEKRRNWTESRANNRKGKTKQEIINPIISKTYVNHMENENENENENEKGIKEAPKKLKIEMPYSDRFVKTWQTWKDYKRKEFGFKFKSEESEQAALIKLTRLAKDEATAVKIIMQSIESGWKGLFEINYNQKNKNNDRTIEERIQNVDNLIGQMFGRS